MGDMEGWLKKADTYRFTFEAKKVKEK